MKQGGSAGSALARLSHASAVKKHASVKRPDGESSASLAPSRDVSAYDMDDDHSVTVSETPTMDDMFQLVDVEDDTEFDVINPLYVHAGSSARFQSSAPRFGQSLLAWLGQYVADKLRTPTGRIDISIVKVSKIAASKSSKCRFRFSINGQVLFLRIV